jgi:putative tryptophan/tyrosine transport system substrate-binding protein
MRDLGYVEGRNIAYEFRHYGDDIESIPSLIGDVLKAKVDVIVAGGTAAIRVAKQATQSIPIVMGAAADPAGVGLTAGRARPVKRLELLKEVMPQAVRIAILQKPGNPAHPLFIKEIEPAASLLGLTYRIFEARGSEDFESSFALMRAWVGRHRRTASRRRERPRWQPSVKGGSGGNIEAFCGTGIVYPCHTRFRAETLDVH